MLALVQRLLALALSILLCGCGGGGGGSPSRVVPRFAGSDVTVAAAAGQGALEIALLGDAPLPVLAQVDLLFDAGSLVFAAPTAIAAVADLDGRLVAPGRYRLVVGDASSKAGDPLPTGKLLRLPFSLGPAVHSGSVLVITFDASRGAAAAGVLADTETAPGALRITVR